LAGDGGLFDVLRQVSALVPAVWGLALGSNAVLEAYVRRQALPAMSLAESSGWLRDGQRAQISAQLPKADPIREVAESMAECAGSEAECRAALLGQRQLRMRRGRLRGVFRSTTRIVMAACTVLGLGRLASSLGGRPAIVDASLLFAAGLCAAALAGVQWSLKGRKADGELLGRDRLLGRFVALRLGEDQEQAVTQRRNLPCEVDPGSANIDA
jgi:hypothetical protein